MLLNLAETNLGSRAEIWDRFPSSGCEMAAQPILTAEVVGGVGASVEVPFLRTMHHCVSVRCRLGDLLVAETRTINRLGTASLPCHER